MIKNIYFKLFNNVQTSAAKISIRDLRKITQLRKKIDCGKIAFYSRLLKELRIGELFQQTLITHLSSVLFYLIHL